MRQYTVYVDQSGKVGNSKMDTGLAYSQEGGKAEEISKTVVIPKNHKSKIKSKAVNSLGSQEKYRLKLFSLGIYLLTENDLDKIKEIVIDQEWQGKMLQIKDYLYNFYQGGKGYKTGDCPEISVEQVHSLLSDPLCHELAYDARERNINPDFIPSYRFVKATLLTSPGKGRNVRN